MITVTVHLNRDGEPETVEVPKGVELRVEQKADDGGGPWSASYRVQPREKGPMTVFLDEPILSRRSSDE